MKFLNESVEKKTNQNWTLNNNYKCLGFGYILTPYILETLRAMKKSGLIWLFSDFRGEDLNVKVYDGKKQVSKLHIYH